MSKLTPPSLRTLIKKPGRHGDGNGLFFRTLGDAKAYWVYRFRINGREREMSLGPYPELRLGEARRKHASEPERVARIAAPAAETTVVSSSRSRSSAAVLSCVRTVGGPC